jgi:hypothetical protein
MTLIEFWGNLALGHFGLRDSPSANGAVHARGATINCGVSIPAIEPRRVEIHG